MKQMIIYKSVFTLSYPLVVIFLTLSLQADPLREKINEQFYLENASILKIMKILLNSLVNINIQNVMC